MSDDWKHVQRLSWEERASPFLANMLQSRENAQQFLKHPQAAVRMVAIEVLRHHWGPDVALARSCEKMALDDSDHDVRVVALVVLASWYAGSDDPRVGRILAGIVHDQRQPSKVRWTAYECLSTLRKNTPAWDVNREASESAFPRSVDWSFVDSFSDESRLPTPVGPLNGSMAGMSQNEAQLVELYRQGVAAINRQDYEKCVEHATDILDSMPYAAGASYLRGRAYIELGRLDDAIADLSRALEATPNSAAVLLQRGRAYRLKGAVDLAECDERSAAASS